MTKYRLIRPRSRFFGTVLFFLFTVFALSSCKDDKELGLEVQPEGGIIGLAYSDTFTVEAFTIKEDSLITDGRSLNIIGRYVDNVFGYHQANIVTQLELASSLDFDNPADIVVDSVVLALAYNNSYGDVSQPQSFKIFEITEDLSLTEDYQYSRIPLFNAVEIGSLENHVPKVLDSVTVKGIREPAQLRIPLDVNMMRAKLIESGTAIYEDNDAFQEHFKGLYITSSYNGQGTNGAMLYFNALSSFTRVTMYYRDLAIDDTLELEYLIDDSSARYTEFIHNYSNSIVNDVIGEADKGKDNLFVQSMAGLKVRLDFPTLENLVDDGPVIINKAEITFHLEDNSTGVFPGHQQLFLANILEDGTADLVLDQFEGTAHFGGSLDLTTLDYTFNITRHVQELLKTHLDGGEYNYGMFLVAGGGSVNANRTILKGLEHPTGPVTFTISYTPL